MGAEEGQLVEVDVLAPDLQIGTGVDQGRLEPQLLADGIDESRKQCSAAAQQHRR